MERYAGKDFSNPVKSNSVIRYAQLCSDKRQVDEQKKEADFSEGYRKGCLRLAVASKHLNMIDCGLDRFVEAGNNAVWQRDGDNIVRVDNNLDWIDDILKEENA